MWATSYSNILEDLVAKTNLVPLHVTITIDGGDRRRQRQTTEDRTYIDFKEIFVRKEGEQEGKVRKKGST